VKGQLSLLSILVMMVFGGGCLRFSPKDSGYKQIIIKYGTGNLDGGKSVIPVNDSVFDYVEFWRNTDGDYCKADGRTARGELVHDAVAIECHGKNESVKLQTHINCASIPKEDLALSHFFGQYGEGNFQNFDVWCE
jgi:hypothetical protein